MLWFKKKYILLFIAIVLFAAFIFLPSFSQRVFLPEASGGAIAENFAKIRNSFGKISDIFFSPYMLFENKLPTIELEIDQESAAHDEVSTKALFKAGEFESKISLSYFDDSFDIKFLDNNIFNGASSLHFAAPSDKGYYDELLNTYRADKFGLTAKKIQLWNVSVNHKNIGVYLVSDNWSKEFLEGRRVPEASIIFSEEKIKENREELAALLSIVESADDEIFSKAIPLVVDLDKFYKWDVLNILAGAEPQEFKNFVLMFNTATGKFEIIPFNVEIGTFQDNYDNYSVLAKRILSIKEFKYARDHVLLSYIEDKNNLQDDLDFYDRAHKQARVALFQDYSKKDNNFAYLRQTKEIRQNFIDNFNKAKKILDIKYPPFASNSKNGNFKFKGSFSRFNESFFSIEEFLSSNPEFYRNGDNGLLLKHGTHIFRKDVIIPAGLNFIISSGAIIYLDKGVSIISYSPVVAKAEEGEQISFLPINSANSWGTFAVIGTEGKESILYNVMFDGGAGNLVNGITFTGQAAFHNSDVVIRKSMFKNAGNDDGLNMKYGKLLLEDSRFEGNLSDGLDTDFASSDSVIAHNYFINNGYGGGGDGIDISWSNIEIKNNDINGCTDKGISIGESSRPTITSNAIQNCDIGIAVKDLSEAHLIGNDIKNSRLGISVYQKKSVFGGGIARIQANTFDNVETEYDQDEKSSIYEFTE